MQPSNRVRRLFSQICAAAQAPAAKDAEMPLLERREIPLLDATPENFAPFGTILGAGPSPKASADSGAQRYAALRVSNPSANFTSDDDTCMIVISYNPRAFECEFMERHYKHTQVFIPLGGKPLVGFFAPPNDSEEPDLDKVVALRFDGSAGFVMHKGTWHEQPFPIEPETNAICVLRKETVRELKPVPGSRECHGQDIDKLDLKERHNMIFTTKVE